MDQTDNLLTTQEQAALEKIAEQGDTNAQRAQALLYINAGMQHKEAAEAAGLTVGQANYALKKFRTQRLLAFPGALAYLEEATAVTKPEPELAKPVSKTQTRIDILLAELDKLVVDLRAALPDADNSPYSPLRLIGLVRENLSKYTPEVQLHILEQFEGMSREDLMDVDTWKGIAYMIAYSAQFQVSQTKDRLNAQMPQPLKPDTILQFIKDGLDRLMPEIAKDLAGTLEGASRDDLKDPDTWKGMVYMLSYSAQFQASQTKDKLNETLPGPIKPDTLWKLFKDSLNRVTPDVAKQIIASFEGATRDDLLDPDTWKGVWYMLNYSLQFQAEQIKVRLLGEAEEETK
ncbi:MAG: hypothetical protein KDE48_00865 [Anaerolineales bacterium]|nr:hypothetical protein [Anaerolineales bacterium]